MLRRVRIENLVLIQEAQLELAPGLNAITGETGAGKTILAQAVGLLLGARGDAAYVGAGGEEAYVEAELDLPEGALDDESLDALADLRPGDEEGLVVARRVFADGRTRAYAWGRAAAREDVELVGGPRQPALLELPGHGNQPLAESGDVLPRRRAAPRVGARPAVREDAAREHEALLALGPELRERLEPLLVENALGQVELGLDVRLLPAGAHVAGLPLRAEEQADGLGEDRLPRPRLAGDRVQPRSELELRLLDQDEVLDAQPTEQRCS